jgi:hypothetical protein
MSHDAGGFYGGRVPHISHGCTIQIINLVHSLLKVYHTYVTPDHAPLISYKIDHFHFIN